ncbi:hypothetical protein Mal64_30630 [Pseudobythopirellula maris]|uniref:PEP-CTERM protein-sorting domain-containing protein n=1 Tax=Pseudobythopirellula maris TaxID=2527991 RepID=A0A5C5ZJF8_9BACT|nr:PEP-CTERM sorting domain-containing protein [Pseudobythopirellula maris]TWT87522.1 hypothetical protein Mal64_30630 [Pseudobythopirellula maris]
MKKFGLAIALMALATAAQAATSLTVLETTPGTYTVSLDTDLEFNGFAVYVNAIDDGVVANGVNIVAPNPAFGGQKYISQFVPTFSFLTPLGSPSTDGLFEPDPNGDIGLSYGVGSPGTTFVGLTAQPYMQFDLISGAANVFFRVLNNGVDLETDSVNIGGSAPVIPEPTMIAVFGGLLGGMGLIRRRR